MSEDYYKARISELERDLEAAHLELGQYGADIKMLEKRLEEEHERKLWELYRDANSLGMKPQHAMNAASWALKVWKERK